MDTADGASVRQTTEEALAPHEHVAGADIDDDALTAEEKDFTLALTRCSSEGKRQGLDDYNSDSPTLWPSWTDTNEGTQERVTDTSTSSFDLVTCERINSMCWSCDAAFEGLCEDGACASQNPSEWKMESGITNLTTHAGQSLFDKVRMFAGERAKEQKRKFHLVIACAVRVIALGVGIYILATLSPVLGMPVLVHVSLMFSGQGIINMGVLLASTCPIDVLDWDEFAVKKPNTLVGLSLVLAAWQASYAVTFPHFNALGALVALAAAAGAWKKLRSWWPRTTTLHPLVLLLDDLAKGLAYCFPSSNPLSTEATDGEYVSYSLGAIHLLGATLCAVVWLWRRWRYMRTMARSGSDGSAASATHQRVHGGSGPTNLVAHAETHIAGAHGHFSEATSCSSCYSHFSHNSHNGLHAAHRGKSARSQFNRGAHPTRAFYELLYATNAIEGLKFIALGIFQILLPTLGFSWPYSGVLVIAIGVVLLLPVCLVMTVGRRAIFNFMVSWFDQDRSRLCRDGAFVATLLDSIPVEVGGTWWIRRDCDDDRFAEFDPHRSWQPGVIKGMDEHEFVVQLDAQDSGGSGSSSSGGDVRRLPVCHLGACATAEEMLAQAQGGIRCVEWHSFSEELMRRADGHNDEMLSQDWYDLSRPVRPGEMIDYFLSNSWYDDPEAKWRKLQEVVHKFHRRYGRFPTFWLDKCCILQNRITDGLKVLPVYVMACRKMLVLCGQTYPTRLWCIWELFTLFAFTSEQAALRRLHFVYLGNEKDGLVMLRGLQSFHVKDAHCYDPNEEERLLRVIAAVGTARFDARIRNMANAWSKQLESSSAAPMLTRASTLASLS